MKLHLADAEIYFEDRGAGDPLVLLHAFPFDHRMWQGQTSDLARKYRVIAPDFRGLGFSTGVGTIEGAADDLAQLLDHLNVDKAVVAGLSLGGYVALAFARRHAARLAGLALACSRATADDDTARAARDDNITRVVRGDLAGFLAQFLPRLVSPGHAAALDLASAIAGVQSIAGVASALAALRDRPDQSSLLRKIRVPTVVIHGSDDTLIPRADIEQLATRIPGAKRVKIAAGHLANLEAPAEFNRALERLMERAFAASPG